MTDRILTPLDDKYAAIPFAYDAGALGAIRPDQVPRFFGAMTDAESLPVKKFAFADLTAMQNRVDPAKVEKMRGKDGKPPLVVINGDRTWLADGHHRAVAKWLDGADELDAHWKDITEVSNTVKVAKVDDGLGLVFGWAIICKLNGEDYTDTQNDHISEDVMLTAAAEFFAGDRIAKDMHAGGPAGKIVFGFPVTADIAKSMGLVTNQTGLMIAMKPDTADMLNKFRTGEYSGFSIGGKGERHDA